MYEKEGYAAVSNVITEDESKTKISQFQATINHCFPREQTQPGTTVIEKVLINQDY